VELYAFDSASGVQAIEYRINGGSAQSYSEPLLFMEEGLQHIQYRSCDWAGNYSEWQDSEIWVSAGQQGPAIIADASIDGDDRLVIPNARNGLPMVRLGGNEPSEGGALSNLPSYALGGEYLLWEEEDIARDETSVIRFRVTTDAVVYLFLPPDADVPGGWSYVGESPRINRTYYRNGSRVYMKRCYGESWVELPGSRAGSLPPFIAVQEWKPVFADIEVRPARLLPNLEPSLAPETFGPLEAGDCEAGTTGVLNARTADWQASRRLALRKQWLVSTEAEWVSLETNTYTLPSDPSVGYVRFRLELYAPDGQLEYRTEKTIGIKEVE
jgi:hypothetical protein